jgi:hypothetical protein
MSNVDDRHRHDVIAIFPFAIFPQDSEWCGFVQRVSWPRCELIDPEQSSITLISSVVAVTIER